LRIFIVLKNSSPSAAFEHTNLGAKGKHADHYTTEDDSLPLWPYIRLRNLDHVMLCVVVYWWVELRIFVCRLTPSNVGKGSVKT
jgi:hypothetical protein